MLHPFRILHRELKELFLRQIGETSLANVRTLVGLHGQRGLSAIGPEVPDPFEFFYGAETLELLVRGAAPFTEHNLQRLHGLHHRFHFFGVSAGRGCR